MNFRVLGHYFVVVYCVKTLIICMVLKAELTLESMLETLRMSSGSTLCRFEAICAAFICLFFNDSISAKSPRKEEPPPPKSIL